MTFFLCFISLQISRKFDSYLYNPPTPLYSYTSTPFFLKAKNLDSLRIAQYRITGYNKPDIDCFNLQFIR